MIEKRLNELRASEDSRPILDLSMTFETMVPYLKGLYLTLNLWN